MYRKVMRQVSFVLILLLAAGASAATLQWDNGGASPLWNVAENWDPDGVPTAADTAQVYLPDANCVIDDSVAAECTTLYVGGAAEGVGYLDMTGGSLTMDGHLRVGHSSDREGLMIMSGGVANMGVVNGTNGRLWVGMNGTGTLIMRGGEMNVYDKIEIGKNASGVGIVYVEGGTMNFSGNSTDLEIATYGTGTFYMTGGVVNVQDNIKLAQGNTSTTSGVARLYLYGGTLNAGNLRNPNQIYGDPLVEIRAGVLTLPGDYTAMVNEYIDRGWIIAYDGLGVVDVTHTLDPNQTVVTGRPLPPELASHPAPRNRATVARPVTLAWQPGIYATSHDVYFGTDFNDVNAATVTEPLGVLVAQAQDANTFDPGPLALGQTYYWRVDEVNTVDPNAPYRGVIFQFTVADYVVIEDFESYNDLPTDDPNSHLVYYTWVDGYENPAVNGGAIGYLTGTSLETAVVHGGKQSVPLTYNNLAATYSEATVKLEDLGVETDWTKDGFQSLTLWFYGNPGNSTADVMYVKLFGPNDATGSKVVYDGEAVNLMTATWREWRIDLAGFNLDLSNVAKLGVGFERGLAGGSGVVLFDDIRASVAPAQEAQ